MGNAQHDVETSKQIAKEATKAALKAKADLEAIQRRARELLAKPIYPF